VSFSQKVEEKMEVDNAEVSEVKEIKIDANVSLILYFF
jgi:hypothetical protein